MQQAQTSENMVTQYKGQRFSIEPEVWVTAPQGMYSGFYLPNGFYKVPKVINPSSNNTGLSEYLPSNIILKRISLECDIAYQPIRLVVPTDHRITPYKAKMG